jgi:hypothetical protein
VSADRWSKDSSFVNGRYAFHHLSTLLESCIIGRLLQQAVAEASKLPEAEQEAVGAWILAELESERRWDDLFAKSHDMLAKVAAEAIREDEAGLTQPLDPDDI